MNFIKLKRAICPISAFWRITTFLEKKIRQNDVVGVLAFLSESCFRQFVCLPLNHLIS
jgi:hypothetical protein